MTIAVGGCKDEMGTGVTVATCAQAASPAPVPSPANVKKRRRDTVVPRLEFFGCMVWLL